MAASYKALRGRIRALNDTSTQNGTNGFNRYECSPLPLLIGSSSFAAAEDAGLSAPVRKAAQEQEPWESEDDEDERLLAARRRSANPAAEGDGSASLPAHDTQAAAAQDQCEQARLEALLQDPLFSSSLLPVPQEGTAAAAAEGAAAGVAGGTQVPAPAAPSSLAPSA